MGQKTRKQKAKSRTKEANGDLKRALIIALEDQFYPEQRAVATQLTNAIERAGLLTRQQLSDITMPGFVPVLSEEFTEEGAEELTHILMCAVREHNIGLEKPQNTVAEQPKEKAAEPTGAGNLEQVLVTIATERKCMVQGKSTAARAVGTQLQGPTPRLDLVLGGVVPMPKPRKTGTVIREQWLLSLHKATDEVRKEFEVPGDIQQYYTGMCPVGQRLLVSAISKKAQSIYDYKIGRVMYRQNRKK